VMAKFKEILGTEIWQFMLLPVPPKIFHGVELGRIGRKKLDRQSIVGAADKLPDHSATMTSKAVPYHQDFPADMAQQVFQKLHHLGAANRTGKQTKVKLSPAHPRHSRQMLPVEMILENRRLSFRRPGPTTMRPFAQSALVDKHYRAFFPLGFFLSFGQRLFFHRSIFSSSRSNARFAGLWQLQPSPCKIRHTWAGWYLTPHSCSIRSATLDVVHSSVVYPLAWAPCVSWVSTRRRSVVLSKGFLPARPAFLSPRIPDSLSSLSQRFTDWRCTPTRRATSACETPARNSRAASSRRCSSLSKFLRTPIGFPMHPKLSQKSKNVTILYRPQ